MNDNLIQRMEFQIQIDQMSEFDLIAKEIPTLVSADLENIITQTIQSLEVDHQVILIEQLVLDLGRLNISNLKYELKEKFRLAFLTELEKNLINKRFARIPDQELSFFIFVYFVKNGIRPWWLSNRIEHFAVFANQAFLLQPSKFLSYLTEFIRRPEFRKRILDHLPEDLLVKALLREKRMDQVISSEAIFSIKDFLKRNFKNWSEMKINRAFKELLLFLFSYHQPIDRVWKFNLAIGDSLDRLNPLGSRWSGLPGIIYPVSKDHRIGFAKHEFSPLVQRSRAAQLDHGHDSYIQWFQFYLENGFASPDIRTAAYNYRNLNYLFKYLILNQFGLVTALLLRLGKSKVVKKRFLESISQEQLDQFFFILAPSKRKLLDWVVEVYQAVQQDYKPINQTFINVKKSINEITFELFLNKKLNQINDENYLRFLFKQSSKKFGVTYRNLLFFTLKSLASRDKKYRSTRFFETLQAIYEKDILRRTPYFSAARTGIDWTEPTSKLTAADFRNRDFIQRLFLYQYRQVKTPNLSSAADWLASKLESQTMDSITDLLRLWEVFATRFGLKAEQILIPVLLEKQKNPTIKLSDQEFNFWKRKYKIDGLYANKKLNRSRFLLTLRNYRQSLPPELMKSIILGIKWGKELEKDFERIAALILPSSTKLVEQLLDWFEGIVSQKRLKANKYQVYNWILYQLAVLPKRNLTLESLQSKTLEYLQIEDKAWESNVGSLTSSSIKRKIASRNTELNNFSQSQTARTSFPKSGHRIDRFFEIIGRSSVLAIFPESKRYGDKILLELMTSRFKDEFLELLKLHQFNEELQDYLLIQAPIWLKLRILDFLAEDSLQSWSVTVSSIQAHFEKTKWIKLTGASLTTFIEKNLWLEIHQSQRISLRELISQQLQSALSAGLISKSFFSDLSDFELWDKRFPDLYPTHSNDAMGMLIGTDFLEYVRNVTKKSIQGSAKVQLLEYILLESKFPKEHPFEGYPLAEFRTYIQELIQAEKKSILRVLEQAKSSVSLLRFLSFFDVKQLSFVIDQTHRKRSIRLDSLQIYKILSILGIKEEPKIQEFFVAWVELLYIGKFDPRDFVKFNLKFFEKLIESGRVPLPSLILISDWNPIIQILGLEGEAKKLFLEKLGSLLRRQALCLNKETPILKGSAEILVMKEMQSYIRGSRAFDLKVLIKYINQAESPVLLPPLLELLDIKQLRHITQERHKKLGFSSLLNRLDQLFTHYRIIEESKIRVFLISWICTLYFKITEQDKLGKLISEALHVLLEEGILSLASFNLEGDHSELFSIVEMDGGQSDFFLREFFPQLKAKRVNQESQLSLFVKGQRIKIADLEILVRKSMQEVHLQKQILTLLQEIKSPVVLLQILKTLDGSTLRLLVMISHHELGFPNLLKQFEALFSFFKVTEVVKINAFFVAWIAKLFVLKTKQADQFELSLAGFKILITSGIIPIASIRTLSDWKLLMRGFSMAPAEEDRLVSELLQLIGSSKSTDLTEFTLHPEINKSRIKNPMDLIYSPFGLDYSENGNIVALLLEAGLIKNAHRIHLEEWTKFSINYQSNEYLKTVFHSYFSINLKSDSNPRIFKSQLFYQMVETLISGRQDLSLFLNRVRLNPTLIRGIQWKGLVGISKELSKKWFRVWVSVNGSLSEADSSKESIQFAFRLFLNSGSSVLSSDQVFQESKAELFKRLERLTLHQLFMLKPHSEVFLEWVKLKPKEDIDTYFGRELAIHLKEELGIKFLRDWVEEFLSQADQVLIAKFLQAFHNSFYLSSRPRTQKLKFFLEAFLMLNQAESAFRKIRDGEVGERDLFDRQVFFRNNAAALEYLIPEESTGITALSPLEIFRRYLEVGLIFQQTLSLQEVSREISALKGPELDQLRIYIHVGLQSENRKKNFFKLLAYLDEKWVFDLINEDLFTSFFELRKSILARTSIDFFTDLRIGKKLDRMHFIVSLWAKNQIKVKNALQILLPVLEDWVEIADSKLVLKVFSPVNFKSNLLFQLRNSSKKLKKILEEDSERKKLEEKESIPEEIQEVDYGEGVTVGNAGLVLLWPFMGRFFNALGMVGREGMKSEEIRERAILLLQYIATGQVEFEEWDLTLNKILCGANPDFPVAGKIDLSDEERELCDKLIKGTIYNWEKMRGTRMETFRETFIQRDGRLFQKENRWELLVDTKAYDVLLDTLPWNLSMINLSWMSTRITVQWR